MSEPSDLPELPDRARLFIKMDRHLRDSLDRETDRGLALVVGALLDDALYELLVAATVEDNDARKRLFGAKDRGSDSPLGTFSSRITACYLLGLYSKPVYHHLDLFRQIRNKFGHAAEPMSFECDPIRGLVGCLRGEIVDVLAENVRKLSPRDRFYTCAVWALTGLHNLAVGIKRREVWPSSLDTGLMDEEAFARTGEWVRQAQQGKIPRPAIWYR